mgnify:CR=1 FL=1
MPRSTEIVGEKTNSTGLIIHRIIAYVVLVLLVVVSLFPFYLLIINATRGRSQAGIRWKAILKEPLHMIGICWIGK